MKPKVRFFKSLKQLTGCIGLALPHAGEIHLDSSLLTDKKELKATLKHERMHFKHYFSFLKDKNYFSYSLKEFLLEVSDSHSFQRQVMLYILVSLLSVLATLWIMA